MVNKKTEKANACISYMKSNFWFTFSEQVPPIRRKKKTEVAGKMIGKFVMEAITH